MCVIVVCVRRCETLQTHTHYASSSIPRPSLWPPALMLFPSTRAESVSFTPGQTHTHTRQHASDTRDKLMKNSCLAHIYPKIKREEIKSHILYKETSLFWFWGHEIYPDIHFSAHVAYIDYDRNTVGIKALQACGYNNVALLLIRNNSIKQKMKSIKKKKNKKFN